MTAMQTSATWMHNNLMVKCTHVYPGPSFRCREHQYCYILICRQSIMNKNNWKDNITYQMFHFISLRAINTLFYDLQPINQAIWELQWRFAGDVKITLKWHHGTARGLSINSKSDRVLYNWLSINSQSDRVLHNGLSINSQSDRVLHNG